jgi:hypothetical protein
LKTFPNSAGIPQISQIFKILPFSSIQYPVRNGPNVQFQWTVLISYSILACNFISFEIKEIDSKNVTDFINGFLQTEFI